MIKLVLACIVLQDFSERPENRVPGIENPEPARVRGKPTVHKS
jgi:hypothetical protein